VWIRRGSGERPRASKHTHDELSRQESRRERINFRAFLWHAGFLAFASSFMDVSTVVSSMLIEAGGTSLHLGLMTAIMLGGAGLFQLAFAGFVSGRARKRKPLLWAINSRVASLLFLGVAVFESPRMSSAAIITAIFVLLSAFSLSGALGSVAYTDILGKSVLGANRQRFFSLRQVISSVGVLASALVAREILTRQEYPSNYATLFVMAAVLLLIGSGGFWRIRETGAAVARRMSARRLIGMIPAEIRRNRNLKYYLLTINSLGLGLSIIPFTILFAKARFGLGFEMVGNFLLLSTIGMLATGVILFRLSGRLVYRRLLAFTLLIGGAIPLLCILLRDHPSAYQLVLVLAGVFVAAYKVAIGGVLLEISTDENRAFYAGISGAGSMATAVFPIAAGWLVPRIGFPALFLIVSALVLLSYVFTSKLACDERPIAQPVSHGAS